MAAQPDGRIYVTSDHSMGWIAMLSLLVYPHGSWVALVGLDKPSIEWSL